MPNLSNDLFFEKWAWTRFGDGNFRIRVYEILRNFGVTSQRAWELTNKIGKRASAFAHFFAVNDTGEIEIDETGNRVYPIWHFIRAMTYKLLLEEFENLDLETLPKQKSKLIELAIVEMPAQQQTVILPYTFAESLQDILTHFKAELPENFPYQRFFTQKAKHIQEVIKIEEQVIKYIKNDRTQNKKPDNEKIASYIHTVADLKNHVLKILVPEPLET